MITENEVVLIVEDEPDDLFLIKKAFSAAGIRNPIHEAEDCEAALDYLEGLGEFANRRLHPLPILVLLDLRLPDKSGLEVVKKIHALNLRRIPVIVFTSSANMADVKAAYQDGATSYIVKPLTAADRQNFAQVLKDYWLGCNLYPAA